MHEITEDLTSTTVIILQRNLQRIIHLENKTYNLQRTKFHTSGVHMDQQTLTCELPLLHNERNKQL